MIDLNKEAEEYAYNLYDETSQIQGFISGANSKYVEAKILQAQIDVYSDLLRQSHNHSAAICRYMIEKSEGLKQQLKQLK